MRRLMIIASFVMMVAQSVASAQPAAAWRPMDFHNFQTPSKTDPLQVLVWPDIIGQANAYVTAELMRPLNGKNALVTALASTFRSGTRVIIVSIALSRACDSGANDKDAEIEPSSCPLRIAIIQDGKLLSLRTETGCYVDHADTDTPPKSRSDNTFAKFEPDVGKLSIRTSVGGRDVASCSKTFSIN